MKKPKSVRVHMNVYGNCGCFEGRTKVLDYGSVWSAKMWLATQVVREGAIISAASYFSEVDIEKYKALV